MQCLFCNERTWLGPISRHQHTVERTILAMVNRDDVGTVWEDDTGYCQWRQRWNCFKGRRWSLSNGTKLELCERTMLAIVNRDNVKTVWKDDAGHCQHKHDVFALPKKCAWFDSACVLKTDPTKPWQQNTENKYLMLLLFLLKHKRNRSFSTLIIYKLKCSNHLYSHTQHLHLNLRRSPLSFILTCTGLHTV